MISVQMTMFSFPEFYEIEDKVIFPKEKENPAVEYLKIKLFDLKNIQDTTPKLFTEQAEDVLDIEKRFFEAKEKGKLITNGTGTGKAQPIYSKILTPNGWKLMGDIKKGDLVISAEGIETKVSGVFPQGKKDVFEITFSDGTKTQCCKEHLWETQTLQERRNQSKLDARPLSTKKVNKDLNRWKPKVRSLEEINSTISKRHFIPVVKPVEFLESNVDIPFYTMGILIGEGCLRNGSLTFSTADLEIYNEVKENLPLGIYIKKSTSRKYDYFINCGKGKKNVYIRYLKELKLYGKKSNHKFIPKKYLFSSIKQREELLQGLLDSDGYVDKKTNSPYYSTTSEKLANDFSDLVRSLGGIAIITNKQSYFTYKGVKKAGLTSFVISVNLPKSIRPFRLKRHSDLYKPNYKYLPKKVIEKIDFIGKVQTQCISVEDERHLYVTDDYILTHNTLVSLGVIKRFILLEKSNILIVVPTDKKCKDWIEEAEDLGIKINQLNGIGDYSPGVNVTTYANFYQNEEILKFHQDLLIYDEAHYLLQNGQGDETVYLSKHKELAKLPSKFKRMIWENKDYYDTLPNEIVEKMFLEFVESTKVLFLSASPFAYVKSLVFGDGCLWDINETKDVNDVLDYAGYNEPSKYQKFFIENFGYRMRTNKLTIPEAGVDMNLMERSFYEKHKKLGAISGRQISVPFDYSRQFVLMDSKIGNDIDEGLKEMSTKNFKDNYPFLYEYYKRKWKYHYTRQLLENIKAKMSVDRVKKHLALDRKVVIFHDYNVSNLSHPFHFEHDKLINYENEKESSQSIRLKEDIFRFEREYSHLVDLDLSDLINPIDLYTRVFGKDNIAIFNGTVSKKKREQHLNDFMNDHFGCDIILIQRKAGKEGISLHDQTGKKQRVLIEFGLPTAPTDAIQVEGRIYRIGLKSNSIYEYLTIQTAFERTTYAFTIAERARTAENLAMGERARNMELIFKEGYQNFIEEDPYEGQGIGGKDADESLDETTEFQKAISFYFSNQKKTAKTKAKEGLDYFATPEPLGYKMTEWLYGLPGNRFLEPSAGHGAIGRFYSTLMDNSFVEPSMELSSRLRLNVQSGEIYNFRFEELSIWNKFDKIAMNPPFGHAGKLAADHLEKAMLHHLYQDMKFKSFSRLICIVPVTSNIKKRILEWSEEKKLIKFFISHEILLPACTFERAGTKVVCNILVIDRKTDAGYETKEIGFNDSENKRTIDLRDCKSINEFFTEIEYLQLTDYNEQKKT